MWHEWKYTFLAIANKHVPLRTKRVRARSSPWITSAIKGLMHKRDILKIKVIKSNAPNDLDVILKTQEYNKQRNKIN